VAVFIPKALGNTLLALLHLACFDHDIVVVTFAVHLDLSESDNFRFHGASGGHRAITRRRGVPQGALTRAHVNLTRQMPDRKIAGVAILDRYFSPIVGPAMITAANVIRGGARIAQAKAHLADAIAEEVVKVARARYRTRECRNVAVGHAIVALGDFFCLRNHPGPTLDFVRRQLRNPRPATRKKAEPFLKRSRSRAKNLA
jgi:hypothetical protein